MNADYFIIALFAIVPGFVLIYFIILKWLKTPSRPFETSASVGKAYDEWTSDGILEYFWGEHIHLGYYEVASWFDVDKTFPRCLLAALISADSGIDAFKMAKTHFVTRMCEFGGLFNTRGYLKIADVGCGIGGTSRVLSRIVDSCSVTGISISRLQIDRAVDLTSAAGIKSVSYVVADAVSMPEIEPHTYDVVWICESSEHVSDKAAFLKEACRILQPGGRLVMAAWCAREPRNDEEASVKEYLEQEWSHPRFASLEEISEILTEKIGMEDLRTEDWTSHTIASWYHSILVGIWRPWIVISQPSLWLKTIREIYTICLMHAAFKAGLMQYGMLTASKPRQ